MPDVEIFNRSVKPELTKIISFYTMPVEPIPMSRQIVLVVMKIARIQYHRMITILSFSSSFNGYSFYPYLD